MSQFDQYDDPRFMEGMQRVTSAMGRRRAVRDRGPFLVKMIFAVLFVVLVSVLWYSYPREAAYQELKAVPLIQAEAGPIKVIPSEPGGMEIPHHESTVFETLRTGRADDAPRIENLLDDAEEPLDRDKLFAGLKTELSVDEDNNLSLVIETPVPSKAKAPKSAPVTVASAAAVPMPESKPLKNTAPSREEAEIVARIAPAAGDDARRSVAPSSAGTHMVQLGSLRSHETAENEWARLQKQFPSQLQALDLRVQEADLGARGTFYRVQGGPLSEAQARSVCAAMEEKRPGGCLVIKR